MTPSYSVSADIERSLLRLTPSGFFDMDAVHGYVAARNAAVERMGCGPNQHVTLCDIREQMVSTPDIAGAFTRMIGDPRYASRKLAFVVTAALARSQTRRIARRDNVEFFADVDAALAWLLDDAATVPGDAAVTPDGQRA